MLDVNMQYLKQHHQDDTLKQIFILSSQLAKLMDLLFCASTDDENDIFYDRSRQEDVELLLDCVEYSEPQNLIEHKNLYYQGKSEYLSI